MEPWIINLICLILAGTIGATSRILVQRINRKEWPHQKPAGFICAITLGGIGGWITWELAKDRLTAYAFGYLFPDIIENLVGRWSPDTEG